MFTPPLNKRELALFKRECCIICGDKVKNFCPEVPHCNPCDEQVVAAYVSNNYWYEEVLSC